MIADLGTRASGVYAPAEEVLLREPPAGTGATILGCDGCSAAGEDRFGRSRERFEQMLGWLDGEESGRLGDFDLESRLESDGRELLRSLFQDHLDLRAEREERVEEVTDVAGVVRGAVEAGHHRPLASESARGSFDDAVAQVRERTGLSIGKRQVEQLADRAAVDFDAFYATRERDRSATEADVLVLSADGKGIVMRPDALAATAKAAARASPKLQTRLSKGEKRNRKRIAEVGAVYDIEPATRTAAGVLARTEEKTTQPPKVSGKWLTASVTRDAASVIADIFAEAERRDPEHRRTWVALVDGNNHQIDRIKTEAKTHKVKVTILIDLIHVLEYLWTAAWCFHEEGDPDAETWVHEKATAILEGRAGIVAAAIRRKATRRGLDGEQRARADRTADYLLNKRPHLDYPTALANGWPIATGIIEGACRHLIKDRMDITGARWSLAGAEAILKLRAIRSNSDFADYWRYHLSQEHHRVHHSRYANATVPRHT